MKRWFARRRVRQDSIANYVPDDVWDKLHLEEQSFLYAIERRVWNHTDDTEFARDLRDFRQLMHLRYLQNNEGSV